MAFKLWNRYSLDSLSQGLQDSKGRLFMSSLGQRNLSAINFLHEGVDTIRQLYCGVLKSEVLDEIKRVYDLGPSHRLITVLGRDWLLGSGGRSSGYRYRLQDNDLGVILFVSSCYVLETNKSSHLKIELSPHFIGSRSASMVQGYMDTLAARILLEPCASGCAVHLCVDLQGWQPPKNFADLLIARSRRRVDHRGISSVDFNLSEVASIYGNSQSFLFGSAGGLQFSLYCKDLQAKSINKMHYWESVWGRRTDENFKPLYEPDKPVWRFEFRYHQSVIREFGESVQKSFLSFADLLLHLTGLFRYALGNFRLNAVSSAASVDAVFYRGVYIDAFWQLLMQDIEILAPHADFFYKRKRRKPGEGRLRNVWLAVGNMLTIHAMNGLCAQESLKCLMQSGVWEDYFSYMKSKFKEKVSDSFLDRYIFRKVDQALKERRLDGVAA